MSLEYDVVVIGAGIGGLASAALLSKKGLKVLVVEKSPIIGGRMATGFIRGCVIDNGPHVYWGGRGKYSMSDFLEKLGKPLKCQKLDCLEIHIDGKVMRYSQKLQEFGSETRRVFGDDVHKDFKKISREVLFANADEYDDVSLKQWLSERTDNEIVHKIMSCMVTIPLTISDLNLLSAGEFLRTFQALEKKLKVYPDLVYPKKGSHAILSSLVDVITEAGGHILTSHRALNVTIKNNQARGVRIKSELTGKQRNIRAKFVINNSPISDVLETVRERNLSRKTISEIRKLSDNYSSGLAVLLGLKKAPTKKTWPALYYHEKGVRYLLSPTNMTGAKPYLFYGHYAEPSFIKDKRKVLESSRELVQELVTYYPKLKDQTNWVVTCTINVIDALARKPGLTGRFSPGITFSGVENLYFVGDSIKGVDNGTARALDTAYQCVEAIGGKRLV